jgi:uncharacterized membrane protein YgdD (TMEM256/DUF423 family)
MHKGFLVWASVLGGLAVTLGAFGAHKLKELVPPETVSTFQTGVTYQFYHVFALLAIAILYAQFPGSLLQWAGRCFIIGVILFSGSLYVLTLLKMTGNVGLKGVGIITPIGGLFFIAGWVCLLLSVLKKG